MINFQEVIVQPFDRVGRCPGPARLTSGGHLRGRGHKLRGHYTLEVSDWNST
jgi:hypothetical protein